MSTVTVGAGPATGLPVSASSSSALVPWTVRNRSAGATTFAPNGNGCTTPRVPPRAIEKPTRLGSLSVFSVTRNAVASLSGLTRSSTRLAALLA